MREAKCGRTNVSQVGQSVTNKRVMLGIVGSNLTICLVFKGPFSEFQVLWIVKSGGIGFMTKRVADRRG